MTDHTAQALAASAAAERERGGTRAAHQPSLLEEVQALLDRALAHVKRQDGMGAFRLLTAPLSALWSEARATAQAESMRMACRAHALHALVQQDPFTQRAAVKPRGYAGDAVMMDYIYDSQAPQGTSELGRAVFAATTRASMGLSVRYRRELLRSLIDETITAVDHARILSVASGHARELQRSMVQGAGFNGQFVALDQDPLSCDELARAHAGERVQVLNRGVRDLMASGDAAAALAAELGSFDLIYSAGLYDYLPDAAARKLTKRLLQMLRPGARLVLANFVPSGSGRAYMEIFMDWTLILRTELAMRELAVAAGATSFSSFLDPHRNVVYVDILR